MTHSSDSQRLTSKALCLRHSGRKCSKHRPKWQQQHYSSSNKMIRMTVGPRRGALYPIIDENAFVFFLGGS